MSQTKDRTTKKTNALPELLSPAGSRTALEAAIEGGADAVYIGSTSFNARINAKNFTEDDLDEAVRLAHAYGVKVYQTLNTLVLDRELDEFLRAAERSLESEIDAFIVADLGAAKLLQKYFPEATLHASTQMSVHSSDGGRALEKYGFSRLVPARELSLENIKSIVNNNPLEVEIFVHGALCVCHSGQCLFSSLVGGRSGNRGLCAQPCRLPYSSGKLQYPLSLKDLSLCEHIPEIIDSGVHSLKIEGRMKSPEYVCLVTRVWRKLLDERRCATKSEMAEMAEAFSRGGFTDGYFTGNVGKKMLGIRSESDKQSSREIEKFDGIKRKTELDMEFFASEGEQIRLCVSRGDKKVTVLGDVAQRAINSPTDVETIRRSMQKLGNTCYSLRELKVDCENVMIPISRLNDLRRRAIEELDTPPVEVKSKASLPERIEFDLPRGKRIAKKSARFLYPAQITKKAREYFDSIYLPLDKYCAEADGFIMPPVIFDSEREDVKCLIEKAASLGAKSAVVTNIAQIEMLKEYNIELVGDYRLNAMNSETVSSLEDMGIFETVCSPELTLPQLRDMRGNVSAIIYGRIPLMTLEKCVIKDLWGCEKCQNNKPGEYTVLKDRRGYEFPVLREGNTHRNIIYNSLPTNMSDRRSELERAGVSNRHFVFTTETAPKVDKIIEDYKNDNAPTDNVRRV